MTLVSLENDGRLRGRAESPSFSIAMTTYNGEKHLREQLESLAAQEARPLELQIGDDGSTDATEEIIKQFARHAPFPVNFVKNRKRLGYGANFIATAQRCSGDWIAFCDQDDVWLPHKLKRCAEAIQESGQDDLVLIVHAAKVVDEALSWNGRFEPDKPRDSICARMLRPLNWDPLGCAQVFHRNLVTGLDNGHRIPSALKNVDPYPHDLWIGLVGNVLGTTIEIAEPLILFRRHGSTTSEAGHAGRRASWAAIATTGSGHYRLLSRVNRQTSESLHHQAAYVRSESWQRRLANGAIVYGKLASALEQRATLYGSKGAGDHFRIMIQLARSGYFGLGSASFGFRAMAKDLVLLLLKASGILDRQGVKGS